VFILFHQYRPTCNLSFCSCCRSKKEDFSKTFLFLFFIDGVVVDDVLMAFTAAFAVAARGRLE